MPHQIIEYSANLDDRLDVQDLVDTMHHTAATCGVFPLAGIRTRAVRRAYYHIADGHPDNTFVNVYMRIAPRPEELRKKAGDILFDALCAYLKPLQDKMPLAISFEIQQLNPDRRRKNNLREYMKERGSYVQEQ
ncbi:MAG: 5-carboxymethyl-2-hydroxymuconate Delta-isomerase [Gammaproteobacteria bacterium]|nr:5-carboxymethyl-2-hydroxymuconate Delta-isomerase [Gammaproteobacteria bacterium]